MAYWPNRSFSVVHYKRNARISDLFRDLDAFGNPFDAKIIFCCDEVAIDFEAVEVSGKLAVKKSMSDRGKTQWIRFPSNIADLSLLVDVGANDGR